MRMHRLAGSLGAGALIAGSASFALAPAASAAQTVSITIDCNSNVALAATPGDTIVITLGTGCTASGVIWNGNGSWPLAGPTSATAAGFLGNQVVVNSSNTGVQGAFGSQNDWYAYSNGLGTTVITATLEGVDGAGTALAAGSQVAAIGPTGSNVPYDITYAGVPSSKNLSIWHQATARSGPDQMCADGWSPSWELWPNAGAGGWVCQRDVYAYYPDEPVR